MSELFIGVTILTISTLKGIHILTKKIKRCSFCSIVSCEQSVSNDVPNSAKSNDDEASEYPIPKPNTNNMAKAYFP